MAGTALRADAWRSKLGFNEYIACQIRYGLLDMPKVPFENGTVLSEFHRTAEYCQIAREDLSRASREGVYEEVGFEEAEALARGVRMISSAFTVWQGVGEDLKGNFVINFKRQTKHWPKCSVKIETLQSFACELQRGDVLMS